MHADDDESVFETARVPLRDLRTTYSEKSPKATEVHAECNNRVRFSLPDSWKIEVTSIANPHESALESLKSAHEKFNVQALEVEEPMVIAQSTPTSNVSPWGTSSRSRRLTLAVRSGISTASGKSTAVSSWPYPGGTFRSTAFSGRSMARSSMVSLGYSEAQPSDPLRRPYIWLRNFLVTALVVSTPLLFLQRQGQWCLRLRADILTWLLPPFFAAGLLSAFVDNRGRYCDDLLLHYWMWKQAETAYVGSLTSTYFHLWLAFSKCSFTSHLGQILGLNISVLGLTCCGLAWVLSTVILNFCIILKLRMLEQHKAANRCYVLLKFQAAFGIPGAFGWGMRFCKSFWRYVGMDWLLRVSTVLSIFGALAMLAYFPFFYFADVAMREVALAADEDVAMGAVPLHERAQVKRAAEWTRWTAAATKASGISILLILMSMITYHFLTSLEIVTTWTLFSLNLAITVDMALNSVCAALLSGLIGPRLHYLDAKVSLFQAGRTLEARRKRDAEEMELASAQLESLHLIPVSHGLQQELHKLERKLSDSYRSQASMVSSESPAELSEATDSNAELSDAIDCYYIKPEVAQAELFAEYRSRCDVEMARMMDLMQSCCTAYQVLRERWKFITEIQNFVDEGFCTQIVSNPRPPPDKIEEGVYSYFAELYGFMAAATDAFHQHFGSVVEEFQRARSASDINLDEIKFPFSIHRKGAPKVQAGPLKMMDRARAKYEEKPDGKTAWPPKAATLLDLIRTTVLFEDPYDLAVFMHFMRSRFRVVRVKNRFKDFNPTLPGGFRNVHTNIVFEHNGRRLIVEVQLHLWALFVAAKMIHGAYEVVRAETLAEVVGPPYKWSESSQKDAELIMQSQPTRGSKKKTPMLQFGSTPKSESSPKSERKGLQMKGLFNMFNPRSVCAQEAGRSSTTSW